MRSKVFQRKIYKAEHPIDPCPWPFKIGKSPKNGQKWYSGRTLVRE